MVPGLLGMNNAKMMARPTVKTPVPYQRPVTLDGYFHYLLTFYDEEPPPTLKTMDIVKVEDGQSKKTTESISDLGSRVQNGCSKGHLLLGIEAGVEVYSTGEKCTLCEPKNYTAYSKTGIGLDSASATGDDTPNGTHDTDVWTKVLAIICEPKKGLETYKRLGS